jgi:hypothetical protein
MESIHYNIIVIWFVLIIISLITNYYNTLYQYDYIGDIPLIDHIVLYNIIRYIPIIFGIFEKYRSKKYKRNQYKYYFYESSVRYGMINGYMMENGNLIKRYRLGDGDYVAEEHISSFPIEAKTLSEFLKKRERIYSVKNILK